MTTIKLTVQNDSFYFNSQPVASTNALKADKVEILALIGDKPSQAQLTAQMEQIQIQNQNQSQLQNQITQLQNQLQIQITQMQNQITQMQNQINQL